MGPDSLVNKFHQDFKKKRHGNPQNMIFGIAIYAMSPLFLVGNRSKTCGTSAWDLQVKKTLGCDGDILGE